MSLTYFKRYQMELDLQFFDIPSPELSPGYRFVPWSEADLDKHADIKYQSFCNEIEDEKIFLNLNDAISPVLIQDKSDNQSYYVIMPMKI